MPRAWAIAAALACAGHLLAGGALGAPPAAPGGGRAAAEPARAASAGRPAVILPTAVVEAGAPRGSERALALVAGGLDALLTDAAQDLGLSVDLNGRGAEEEAPAEERDLVARARAAGALLLAPSVAAAGGEEVDLRIELADPGSRTLRVRAERVAIADAPVRAVVMLRDLVTDLDRCGAARSSGARAGGPEAGARREPGVIAAPARSLGRATLAVSSTLYGGLVGYSIQASSGSSDPRLLYPLLAVGAGIGLGGSILIAEEWNVGIGDAWYLSAGAWWPTLAGHLLYEGRFAKYAGEQDEERWTFGLIGGTTGITLAALGLTLRGGMSDGGAVMTHSGGGLGLVLGGLVEIAATGDIEATPFSGAGYGVAFGWLAAAAAATQIRLPPSRVLSVDLGAMLGGLGGAALGSPLLFDAPTADDQRAWVGATAGGLLVGAAAAWLLTGEPDGGERREASARAGGADRRPGAPSVQPGAGSPMIGVVGESVVGRRRAPALGLGWRGTFL